MKKLTFAEQIKHPNWQRRRLEVMERAGFACQRCDARDVTLNVHHKRYIKGRMYWDYEDADLECLCEKCHQREHEKRVLLERILSEADETHGCALDLAVALLAGYFSSGCCIGPELAREGMAIDGESYDLGVLAYMATGNTWPALARAADALRVLRFTPEEQAAYERWKGESQ